MIARFAFAYLLFFIQNIVISAATTMAASFHEWEQVNNYFLVYDDASKKASLCWYDLRGNFYNVAATSVMSPPPADCKTLHVTIETPLWCFDCVVELPLIVLVNLFEVSHECIVHVKERKHSTYYFAIDSALTVLVIPKNAVNGADESSVSSSSEVLRRELQEFLARFSSDNVACHAAPLSLRYLTSDVWHFVVLDSLVEGDGRSRCASDFSTFSGERSPMMRAFGSPCSGRESALSRVSGLPIDDGSDDELVSFGAVQDRCEPKENCDRARSGLGGLPDIGEGDSKDAMSDDGPVSF